MKKKRWLIGVLALVVGLGYILTGVTKVKAEEKVLGQIDYYSEVVSGSFSTYSNSSTQSFTGTITPDVGKKVSGVFLRHSVTKEKISGGISLSGNEYIVSLSGKEVLLKAATRQEWDITFNWFRAPIPDGDIWMYDLNGRRNFFMYNGIYDGPQNSAKQLLDQPMSDPVRSKLLPLQYTSGGNIGTAKSSVALPAYLSSSTENEVSFPVSKLEEKNINVDYSLVDMKGTRGYITSKDVISRKGELNPSGGVIDFEFTAIYDREPFLIEYSSGEQIVNHYHSKWEGIVTGKIYKYNNLEIVYVQDGGSGGGTGSPTPNNPTPTPAATEDDLEVVSLSYSPATFTPRDNVTFTWVFRNNSNRPWSNFYYSIDGSESIFTSTLNPGETYSSTLTRKIDSERTFVVKIDSRDLIAEFDETNNEKSVTVRPEAITNNSPPEGKLQWFMYGGIVPVDTVVEGTRVELRYVDVKDPDGDAVDYRMNFNEFKSEWLKNYMINKFSSGNGYDSFTNIDTTGGLGSHTAKGRLVDTYGAYKDLSASLTVIPPNPVAACQAPDTIKSMRPIAEDAINSYKSYSPLGRNIDHEKSEWTNKKDFYINDTTETIIERVILNKVYDERGLESLNSDYCDIDIIPDLPPVAKVLAPELGIRGEEFDILNESYSPDNDPIISVVWYMRYDANNDGVFDDVNEPWVRISGDDKKYVFKPTKVGKYKFKIYVEEDYGKNAEKESENMDVVNLPPEVSFDLKGDNMNPDQNTPKMLPGETILNNWDLFYNGSYTKISRVAPYMWQSSKGNLTSGGGKNNESYRSAVNYQYNPGGAGTGTAYNVPLNDNGWGRNGISIYKSYQQTEYSQPLLLPDRDGKPKYTVSGEQIIISDKTHLYIGVNDEKLYALNKNKIGKYTLELDFDFSVQQGEYYHKWWDGNPYDYVLDFSNIPISNLEEMRRVPYYQGSSLRYYQQVRDEVKKGKFYVAGPYIYYIFQRNVPIKLTAEYSDSEGDYTEVHYKYQQMGCSFNADNGSLTSCYNITGDEDGLPFNPSATKMLDSGSNLLLIDSPYGYYDYFGSVVKEINYKGDIVSVKYPQFNKDFIDIPYERKTAYWYAPNTPVSLSPPQFSTMRKTFKNLAEPPYRDAEGNFYFYQLATGTDADGTTVFSPKEPFVRAAYPQFELGIYVAKYDKDFNLVWRAKTSGNALTYEAPYDYNQKDKINAMVVNSLNRTLISKTLLVTPGGMGEAREIKNDLINMDTGYSQPWGGAIVQGMETNVRVDAWGNYIEGRGAFNIFGQNTQVSVPGDPKLIGTVGQFGSATEIISSGKVFEELVGDGLILSSFHIRSWANPHPAQPTDGRSVYWLTKGPVAEGTPSIPRYNYGQFVSPESETNSEITFAFETNQVKTDSNLFGFSFRMADPNNKYSIEFDGNKTYLTKYVWGNRYVLASRDYNIQDRKQYSVKVRTIRDKISVFINKVPYFLEISDTQFTGGTYGPFSDKSFVTFNAMSIKEYEEDHVWGTDFAILDEQTNQAAMSYENINFSDPELDPIAGSFSWRYTHTPMFLNNGGKSSLDGKSYDSGLPVFDRVGKWEVSLLAKDDPAPESKYWYPDNAFGSYRKDSNKFTRFITVHRRPISMFNPSVNVNALTWNDTSYDPDRYDITSGQAEEGYAANRGIFERKHIAISPSGVKYESQLTSLDEGGVWLLGLQVKDEYGAWSYLETKEVEVVKDKIKKPKAVLTYPTGTEESPTFLAKNAQGVANWVVEGEPDTTYTAYEVSVEQHLNGWSGFEINEIGFGITTEVTKTPTLSQATRAFGNVNAKFKIKVRVRNETTWSDWSNEGWFNSIELPTVVLRDPIGTQEEPTFVPTLRPTITWDQKDPTQNSIKKQQIKIWKEDGTLFLDKSIEVPYEDYSKEQASWTLDRDAPAGSKLRVEVRVMNTQSLWSKWSESGWFITNRPPQASMAIPNGSESSPTMFNELRPTFTWYQIDPDADTTFTAYQIQVTNNENTVSLLESGEQWQNTKETSASWTASKDLPTGQKMRVRVRVFDGVVWSDWSIQTWFYINRPPTADFDWSPKPVWEGDTIRIISLSKDPDGDELSFNWKIETPSGEELSGNLPEWTGQWVEPGSYKVTLTVSDGYLSDSAEKIITVQPLTIDASINHTTSWLAYHRDRGHETVNPPKDFYSGEILELVLNSASYPVVMAEAWIDSLNVKGEPLYISTTLTSTPDNQYRFIGEIFDDTIITGTERLPNGLHKVTFKLTYSNGVQKYQDVKFNIIGSIHDTIEVHRLH